MCWILSFFLPRFCIERVGTSVIARESQNSRCLTLEFLKLIGKGFTTIVPTQQSSSQNVVELRIEKYELQCSSRDKLSYSWIMMLVVDDGEWWWMLMMVVDNGV